MDKHWRQMTLSGQALSLVYPVTHLVTYRAPYKPERKAALAGKGGALCKSVNAAICGVAIA